ncbi:hypothetical protein Daus18300_001244 [Diaporthe australafricana]|uniref:Uncharacterized protein n=1 Tax=Diaporthe australafricana TaxID=127596 RepID=A0ABR3XYF9_9PEZI
MATEDQPSQPPAEGNTSTPADENSEHAQDQPPQPPPQISSDGTEPAAPASPPLPSRHTAVTPGPRAQRFHEMFDLALNHTLTKISPENFASCYPTIAAQAPSVLDQVQRAMVDRFADLCNQEFGRVQARYNVVPKLNELEGLVSDAERRRRAQASAARRKASKGKGKEKDTAAEDNSNNNNNDGTGDGGNNNKPTPPHMLPADAVLAAHLAPHLASQQSQMNARLQNTQAANVALWGEVQKQRAEADGLLAALERALADLDGAAALLDEVPAEELARESRAVEVEMTDV